MINNEFRSRTISGFAWRLSQNIGTQIVNFVISIILARLLSPVDYGLMALSMVFINLASVFVQTGFTSSIIQRENISKNELSAIFYISVGATLLIYIFLFLMAPFVSNYYENESIGLILRIQSITLIISSLYSVPQAIMTREMRFKEGFVINLIGSLAHGFTGIYLAVNGYGVWSLVYSNIVGSCFNLLLFRIFTKWSPGKSANLRTIKPLITYSSKLLASSMINALYNNLKSLMIGKIYSSTQLGFFDKGFQFPSLIMTNIEGSMSTVLFASLSRANSENNERLRLLRRSSSVSMYVCAPLMIGLFVVAKPLVLLLLTDKWLDSVPFIKITSIICLTWPLVTRIQAVNAIGESRITLRNNLLTIVVGIILMFLTIKNGIIIFASSTLVASLFGCVLNFLACSKYLGYSVKHQFGDISPSIILSVLMGSIVKTIELIPLNVGVLLVTQLAVGIIVYILLSKLSKNDSYLYILFLLKELSIKRTSKRGELSE